MVASFDLLRAPAKIAFWLASYFSDVMTDKFGVLAFELFGFALLMTVGFATDAFTCAGAEGTIFFAVNDMFLILLIAILAFQAASDVAASPSRTASMSRRMMSRSPTFPRPRRVLVEP